MTVEQRVRSVQRKKNNKSCIVKSFERRNTKKRETFNTETKKGGETRTETQRDGEGH